MTTNIHPTAIVDPAAQLDTGVTVGPYAIIGPHVKVGKNTNIHAHALVTGHTTLGEGNEIFSFAAVGSIPQDLKYKGEPTTLEIGNENRIRECTTLQPGTVQGGGKTIIGHRNLIMAYVHVAHDCILGNENVIANATQLAGHVTMQNQIVIGGMSAVHQFVTIGDLALLGGGTFAAKDVPPFALANGNRATLRGLNLIGLQRRGLSSEVRQAIKQVYRVLYHEGHATVESALAQLPSSLMALPEVQKIVQFVQASKRGTIRPPRSLEEDDE